MSVMASQITNLTIVCSTVYLGTDQRKHQSSASLAFVRGTGDQEFPAKRASNAENVIIWWRHHDHAVFPVCLRTPLCNPISNIPGSEHVKAYLQTDVNASSQTSLINNVKFEQMVIPIPSYPMV